MPFKSDSDFRYGCNQASQWFVRVRALRFCILSLRSTYHIKLHYHHLTQLPGHAIMQIHFNCFCCSGLSLGRNIYNYIYIFAINVYAFEEPKQWWCLWARSIFINFNWTLITACRRNELLVIYGVSWCIY